MKKPLVILILLVAGSGAVFPQGQVAPVRPQKRIITKTRLVALFSDLENQLFQAVQSKDRAGLDSILAEDFQLWTPNPPGDPVPREDWKNQSLAENLKEFQIRQMAARSVEENVTVELRAHQSCKGRWEAPARDYFVADLWQKSED